jgi:hypothetical protein
MYDRGGGSESTKRARALFHINAILQHNQLDNATVGLEEVFANLLLLLSLFT